MNERNTYSRFVNALRAPEYVPLMEGTVNNDSLVRKVRVSIFVFILHLPLFGCLCNPNVLTEAPLYLRKPEHIFQMGI